MGKCPGCDLWNSFFEGHLKKEVPNLKKENLKSIKLLDCLDHKEFQKIEISNKEIAKIFGGGIVDSSTSLLCGEPGIGKSTFLLMLCQSIFEKNKNKKILYVSSEENEFEVAQRARRLNINNKNLLLLNEASIQSIRNVILSLEPILIVIDSIQTTYSEEVSAPLGSIIQIKDVVQNIQHLAKEKKMAFILVGHITKDGQNAGPKTLEHLVDSVFRLERKNKSPIREFKSLKNRYGKTDITSFFEMKENGLFPVERFNKRIFFNRLESKFGSCFGFQLLNEHLLLFEIEALVVENKNSFGKRICYGIENTRVQILVAIIEKYFDLKLSYFDIFLNIKSDFTLNSRESDLCIIMAILSSYHKLCFNLNTCFVGEVGLLGDISEIELDPEISNKIIREGITQLITNTQESPNKLLSILKINNIEQLRVYFQKKAPLLFCSDNR